MRPRSIRMRAAQLGSLALLLSAACPRAPRPSNPGTGRAMGTTPPQTSGDRAYATGPDAGRLDGNSSGPAAARARLSVWAQVREVPLDSSMPHGFFEYDKKLYGLVKGELVGVDSRTGRVVSRLSFAQSGEAHASKIQRDGSSLVVACDHYPRVNLYRVDLAATRVDQIVDCAYDVAPFAKLPNRAVATHFDGAIWSNDRLYVVFSSRHTIKETLSSRIAVLDARCSAPPKIVPIQARSVFDIVRAGATLYIHGSREVIAFDLQADRVRWRYPARDFLRGMAATPDGIFVEEDTSVVRLSPDTGRIEKQRAIVAQGNDGPVVQDGYVFVASKGLARFTPELEPAGQIELDAWLIDHTIAGRFLFGAAHDRLFIVDRERFELVRQLELDDGWFYTGGPWSSGDGFVALTDLHQGSERRLRWYSEVGAEAADLSDLPVGTQIYERGRRLTERPILLTLGAHRVDLVHGTDEPVTLDVSVVAGQSPKMRFEHSSTHASPSAPDDPIPAGIELTDVFERAQRRMPLPPARYGSIRRGRFLGSFDDQLGLSVHNATTLAPAWQIPISDVRTRLVGKTQDAKSRVDLRLVDVLPETGLILLGTGSMPSNRLCALELASGALRWTAPILPRGSSLENTFHDDRDAVVEHADRLWYADGAALYALSARDGHLVQRFDVGIHDSTIADPIFDGDRVFLLYDDALVGARWPDERIDWRLSFPGDVRLRAGPHADDLLVIAAHDIARVSRAGKIVARHAGLGGAIHHMPALVTAEMIYVCGGSRVTALDSNSLRTRWTYDDTSASSPCPVAVSAHQLLVTDGTVAAVLDRATGRIVTRPSLEKLGSVQDVVVSGGAVCLVGDSDLQCMQ